MNFKEDLLENFKQIVDHLPDNIRDYCHGTYDVKLEFYNVSKDETVETIRSYNFEFVELDNHNFELEQHIEILKTVKTL